MTNSLFSILRKITSYCFQLALAFAVSITVEATPGDKNRYYDVLLSGGVFVGEAGQGTTVKWPFEIEIDQYDIRSGELLGRVHWPSLNGVTKISGNYNHVSGTLYFKEIEHIKRGNVALNTTYRMNEIQNSRIVGSWNNKDSNWIWIEIAIPPIEKESDSDSDDRMSGGAHSLSLETKISTDEWFKYIVPKAKLITYQHKQRLNINGKDVWHVGVDIAADCGTEIRAPADGVIVSTIGVGDFLYGSTKWNGKKKLGNSLLIKHMTTAREEPVYSLYLHMMGKPVFPDGEVLRGEKIGLVGKTGFATGCHVHYEVRNFEGEGVNKPLHPGALNIYPSVDSYPSAEDLVDWKNPAAWTLFASQETQNNMSLRFVEDCRSVKENGSVSCPFEEKSMCAGEGGRCMLKGILHTYYEVPIYENPHASKVIWKTRKGQRLTFDAVNTYSVPCIGEVASLGSSSANNRLPVGTEVYRLSYFGEFSYRYLINGTDVRVLNGELVSHERECSARYETWYSVNYGLGLKGWVRNDQAFSRFSGFSINVPPPPESSTFGPNSNDFKTTAYSESSIHYGPGFEYSYYRNLDKGTTVWVNYVHNGWCLINSAEWNWIPCKSLFGPREGWADFPGPLPQRGD